MSKSEKYWVFAICWLFLGQLHDPEPSVWRVVISFSSYAIAAGYFIAMIVYAYREAKD